MSKPFVQLKDSYGNVHFKGDVEGVSWPGFPTIPDFRKQARDIRDLELNPDDVIFTGFVKSGFHWMTSVVHMLKKGRTDSYFKTGMGAMLDRTPVHEGILPPPDQPRVMYTHLPFSFLPEQIRTKKVKVIHLQRNPKDAWVSMYCHAHDHIGEMAFEGSWNHFFELMMSSVFWYDNWFDYVLRWEQDIERERAAGTPIHVCCYEATIKDPVGETERLNQFLGCNRGRELCEQIAKACEFSAMKAVKDGEWKSDKVNFFKQNASGFYRKGEVGDWKNWFTVAQSERFDQQFRDRMKGSNLRYTFK